MTTGIPTTDNSILMVIDVQERLMPVIHEQDKITDNVNKLIKGAGILGMDVVVTEQYPKGLGHTLPEIERTAEIPVFEKDTFSCMLQPVLLDQLQRTNKKHLIICGVEAHICVLKTALDAIEKGYAVHVVADAVSSRTPENKWLALERMRQSGAFIVSVEMILFMLMDCAGTAEFKAVSKLIK